MLSVSLDYLRPVFCVPMLSVSLDCLRPLFCVPMLSVSLDCLRPLFCVPMLSVSLDCPFLNGHSVFVNIYVINNKDLFLSFISLYY